MTGEFPAQMASNAENVAIWWRHHDWSLTGQYYRVLCMKYEQLNWTALTSQGQLVISRKSNGEGYI